MSKHFGWLAGFFATQYAGYILNAGPAKSPATDESLLAGSEKIRLRHGHVDHHR